VLEGDDDGREQEQDRADAKPEISEVSSCRRPAGRVRLQRRHDRAAPHPRIWSL